MAFETELPYLWPLEHLWIRGSMRYMACGTALEFYCRVLEYKWPGFVCMALHAARVGTNCKPRLFHLETTVRIVAIAAVHRALEHLVMKWLCELRLDLIVAADAKLRFALFEHGLAALIR